MNENRKVFIYFFKAGAGGDLHFILAFSVVYKKFDAL